MYKRQSQDSEYSEGNLNEKRESRHAKPAIGLGLDTVENGDQCLIFTMTRKSSVATATEAGMDIVKTLVENQKKELQKISKKILPKDNEDETKLIKKLADTVKNGTAFHHAGLDQRCRAIIETEFRNGNIKLLTATPTLAAGVNLPARRVVIPSVMRYTQNGLDKISVLEYKQMCGRAGRPQYDDEGESIIIAKGSPYDFIEHYVDGEPEPLESKILEEDSSLRIHLLSFIKTSSVFDPVSKEKINNFFSHTFGGYQISDDDNLEEKISKQLDKLKEYDMISGEDSFKPTKFGEKVFWLRLDPKTAFEITGYIENYVQGAKHTFGVLHMITNLPEFYPQIPYEMNEVIIKNEHEKLYTEQKFQDDNCFKSLLILHYWIDAMTFSDMSKNFDAEPGDIFYMQQNAGQLAYAFREIARYWKNQILVDELDIIRKRIRYGVPEKYLELVEIKNVGRVRAKNLYHAGLRTRQSLRDIPLDKLSAIDKIGLTLAKSIKSQVEKVR